MEQPFGCFRRRHWPLRRDRSGRFEKSAGSDEIGEKSVRTTGFALFLPLGELCLFVCLLAC